MVATGFPNGQLKMNQAFHLRAAFFGWFCLLFAMALSGYALDQWEGEAMAMAARWLQHGIMFGASTIAFTRFLSFNRRKPLENLVQALRKINPDSLESAAEKRERGAFKPLRFSVLWFSSLIGLAACALGIEMRLAALALADGIWFLMALDWLLAQYRFRISRAKEKVKEALDDQRSARRPGTAHPVILFQRAPVWSKGMVFLGALAVSGVSYQRLIDEESHVLHAELRTCLKSLLPEDKLRGSIDREDKSCPQDLFNRFDFRAEGLGEERKVWAREKAGIDPLNDGQAGNQAWSLSARGYFRLLN